MSQRLADTFTRLRSSGGPGLVTYVTAGDPGYARSREILLALDRAGADVIELGVPFSEPLADGPVIQRATERALAAGMTLARTLDLVEELRGQVRAPIVLFTYANPIYRLGIDAFAARARQAGVDGVLTLDLPIEEAGPLQKRLAADAIDTIFLVSPTTTDERLRRAGELGSGFLYGISRLGVTGIRADGRRRRGSAGDAHAEGEPAAGRARLRPVAARAHPRRRPLGGCRGRRQRARRRDRARRRFAGRRR